MENDLGLFGQSKSKCHLLQCWHFRVIVLPSLSFRHSSRGSLGGGGFFSGPVGAFDLLGTHFGAVDFLSSSLLMGHEVSKALPG
jgi:hypothetical protein